MSIAKALVKPETTELKVPVLYSMATISDAFATTDMFATSKHGGLHKVAKDQKI